jgi:hypothetical protein
MPAPARRALGARGSIPRSRTLLATGLGALAVAWSATAAAGDDDYRRPGLEGQWSERHLTAPMNSLRIIAGPGQPMLMGIRYADQVIDGGGEFIRQAVVPNQAPENQWWFRGGISFGLTEDWEAGALFIPVQFSPSLSLANVTAFVTRGFRFQAFDFGLRLSFQAPSLKAYDLRDWGFNPGVPFLYRAGAFRLDGGVFVPISTSDGNVGLNFPVRASVSVSPRFFFGLESGFVEPRLDAGHEAAVPLGVLAGYTELFGSKVVDFTAEFAWDDFWLPAEKSRDALELEHYRVNFGLVFHTLVR